MPWEIIWDEFVMYFRERLHETQFRVHLGKATLMMMIDDPMNEDGRRSKLISSLMKQWMQARQLVRDSFIDEKKRNPSYTELRNGHYCRRRRWKWESGSMNGYMDYHMYMYLTVCHLSTYVNQKLSMHAYMHESWYNLIKTLVVFLLFLLRFLLGENLNRVAACVGSKYHCNQQYTTPINAWE